MQNSAEILNTKTYQDTCEIFGQFGIGIQAFLGLISFSTLVCK
jgi:hypothetical protein